MRLMGWILVYFLATAAPVAASQAVSAQWPQSSISWTQLQNLFASYPGVSQFNIQFPNQTNWNVGVNQMETLYSNYSQQAKNLGYGTKMPDLSFSSLPISSSVRGSSVTIPVQNAMNSMQFQADNALRQMHGQINEGKSQVRRSIDSVKESVTAAYNSLPTWLRNGLETAWTVFAAGCLMIWNWLLSLVR